MNSNHWTTSDVSVVHHHDTCFENLLDSLKRRILVCNVHGCGKVPSISPEERVNARQVSLTNGDVGFVVTSWWTVQIEC